MKVLRRLAWGSAKFWLGAIVVVAAGLAVARDAAPANAASTEILVSLSSGSPTYASTVLVLKGNGATYGNGPCVPGDQDPTTICLYIWAKDVANGIGASSFEVKFAYDDSRIGVSALTASRTWLASTGHSVVCPAPTMSPGTGDVNCETLLSTPDWALGSGLLATVALSSRSTVGTTTLDLSNGTFLSQMLCVCDPAPIPATVRSINVFVAPCADFTGGDGIVRTGDILYVVQRYNLTDPAADLDGNGIVKTSDILIAVKEYNWSCRR